MLGRFPACPARVRAVAPSATQQPAGAATAAGGTPPQTATDDRGGARRCGARSPTPPHTRSCLAASSGRRPASVTSGRPQPASAAPPTAPWPPPGRDCGGPAGSAASAGCACALVGSPSLAGWAGPPGEGDASRATAASSSGESRSSGTGRCGLPSGMTGWSTVLVRSVAAPSRSLPEMPLPSCWLPARSTSSHESAWELSISTTDRSAAWAVSAPAPTASETIAAARTVTPPARRRSCRGRGRACREWSPAVMPGRPLAPGDAG